MTGTSSPTMYVLDSISQTRFFVDSGADVSIMPARLLPKCTTNPVFEKFNLTDYRDKNPEIVEAEATLTIQPGVLKARFYVLPNVPHAKIGNDILRNHKHEGVNFRTDREMFEVRGFSAKIRLQRRVENIINAASSAKTIEERRPNG